MKTIRRVGHIRLTRKSSEAYIIRTPNQVIAKLEQRREEDWGAVLQRATAIMSLLDHATPNFLKQHPRKAVKAATKAVDAVYIRFILSGSSRPFGSPEDINKALDRLERGARHRTVGCLTWLVFDLPPHPAWNDSAHFCIDV